MRPEHWIYTVPLRLRSLFRRRHVDEDLAEEIRDHLERRTTDYIAQGLSPEEARYAAQREFGGIEQAKERGLFGRQWEPDAVLGVNRVQQP